MKIIEASVSIENSRPYKELLTLIEAAGRTCYKSEDKITKDSAEKFVKGIVKRGHEAVLEHGTITVRFICDRGCYDDKTQVLTKSRGWQYFKDLRKDDIFYTTTDDGTLTTTGVKEIISYDVDENLINFHSTQVDLLVTKDHNMWLFDENKRAADQKIWKFIKAEDATNCQYRFLKGANLNEVSDSSDFEIPGCHLHYKELPPIHFKREAFFWLLGLWLTDGCIEKRKDVACGLGKLIITQAKQKICDKLEAILKELNISYTKFKNDYCLDCPQLRQWLKNNFLREDDFKKTYYLKLPRWIYDLPTDSLRRLFDGIVDGDGSPTSGSGWQIYTASQDFANDLLELCLLIGKVGNIRIVPSRTRTFSNGYTSQCKEQYVVQVHDKIVHLFSKRKDVKGTYCKEEHYQGKVYCVELNDYHRLYVKRNGKPVWCGNCSHEIVRHRIAAFCQESTRYCNYGSDKFDCEVTFIKPSFWEKDSEQYNMWRDACEYAEAAYLRMLIQGATPQEARSVLPNSVKTELVMTADIREWRHFIKLRTSKAAHPDIRVISIELLKQFKKDYPVFFEDIEVEE